MSVIAFAPDSGITAAACAALGVSRASVQRRRARLAAPPAIVRPRPRPPRALSIPQQQLVLDLLHAPRFADQAPAEIYASLLDQASTIARSAPCIASSSQQARSANAARSSGIQPIRNPNCWRNVPIRSGPGISPNLWDQRSGPTSISTSSSTSSAVVSSAGVSPMRKAPRYSGHCPMTPSRNMMCRPASSPCMPTVADR